MPSMVLPDPEMLEGRLEVGAKLWWGEGIGQVRALWGPERLRGEWWSRPFERDYFVAELTDGMRLWVYRDRRLRALFLHGFFD